MSVTITPVAPAPAPAAVAPPLEHEPAPALRIGAARELPEVSLARVTIAVAVLLVGGNLPFETCSWLDWIALYMVAAVAAITAIVAAIIARDRRRDRRADLIDLS